MEAEWSKVGICKGKVSVAPHPANPKAAEREMGLIIFFPRNYLTHLFNRGVLDSREEASLGGAFAFFLSFVPTIIHSSLHPKKKMKSYFLSLLLKSLANFTPQLPLPPPTYLFCP